MAKSKAMEKLLALTGAVTDRSSVHNNVLESSSPSLNFIFGNGQGLPEGYTAMLYGPPKGGKSLICNDLAGTLHKNDPDAVVVKFNTEHRERAQVDSEQLKVWGIDEDRYIVYEVSSAKDVFNRIAHELKEAVKDGLKIKLVIIDSINGILGRRGENANDIDVMQMADQAATLQQGFGMILPVQRECGFAVVLVAQVRAVLDALEQMRGKKVRPAAANATQHYAEYFIYVEPDQSKDGKVDLLGNEFKNEGKKDASGNAEKTAHKIKARMMDSSLGPKGRTGEFTFDYYKGIDNVHEEVFLLGTGQGIIERPNNTTYVYQDKKWVGKGAMLNALKEDKNMQTEILRELKRREMSREIIEPKLPEFEEEEESVLDDSPRKKRKKG